MLAKEITDIFQHDGPVVIVTNSGSDAHVVGTWNNYLEIIDDSSMAVPAWGYKQTEQNINNGSQVQLLVATRHLPGKSGNPGRGFKLAGKGRFETEGETFQKLSSRFSGIRAAFIITVEQVEQQI